MSVRRWIAVIAGAGALLVVGGVIENRMGTHTAASRQPLLFTSAASTKDRPDHLGAMTLRIPYGLTANGVRRQLGAPTELEPGCWLYRGRVGTIRGRYSGDYVDAVKFCFSDGPTGSPVVTRILSHMPKHTIVIRDSATHKILRRTTYQAGWGLPLTIQKPPDWYLQQSS